MGKHKTLERNLLVGHRMEERAQLFRRVVTGEDPDKLLVFEFPKLGIVRVVRDIGGHGTHQHLHGVRHGQLAAIDFGVRMPVRVEIGKDALFGVADRVVEFMHQQGYIAQGRSVALAHAGNEHDFSGTQNFIVEQRACDPDVPRTAENKVVDVRIVIMHRRTGRITLHLKGAIGGKLVAKRRFRTEKSVRGLFFVHGRIYFIHKEPGLPYAQSGKYSLSYYLCQEA